MSTVWTVGVNKRSFKRHVEKDEMTIKKIHNLPVSAETVIKMKNNGCVEKEDRSLVNLRRQSHETSLQTGR